MTATTLNVRPLDATFGAVVTGLALRNLDIATFLDIYALWLDRGLLIFPGQHLTREEQIFFGQRFGPLEFDYAPLSNVRADGTVRDDIPQDEIIKILKGNMGWHCDSTYMPVQAKGAVFSAHTVPAKDGETEWADMRAAYEALDNATKARIADMKAHHSLHYSQARAGLSPAEDSEYSGYGFHVAEAQLRPLVKIHPETGAKCLMVGRHAHAIPGLTPEDSERLLDELVDFACQPPRVYRHRWAPGDVVVWDNRSLMHRACPWDMREARVMHHTRLAGDPASEASLSH